MVMKEPSTAPSGCGHFTGLRTPPDKRVRRAPAPVPTFPNVSPKGGHKRDRGTEPESGTSGRRKEKAHFHNKNTLLYEVRLIA